MGLFKLSMDERLARFILKVVVKKHRTTEWLPVFILSERHEDYITTFGNVKDFAPFSSSSRPMPLEKFPYAIHKRKLPSKCAEIIFNELPTAGITVYTLFPTVYGLGFNSTEILGLVIHTQ